MTGSPSTQASVVATAAAAAERQLWAMFQKTDLATYEVTSPRLAKSGSFCLSPNQHLIWSVNPKSFSKSDILTLLKPSLVIWGWVNSYMTIRTRRWTSILQAICVKNPDVGILTRNHSCPSRSRWDSPTICWCHTLVQGNCWDLKSMTHEAWYVQTADLTDGWYSQQRQPQESLSLSGSWYFILQRPHWPYFQVLTSISLYIKAWKWPSLQISFA